jgi:hypothetical protein
MLYTEFMGIFIVYKNNGNTTDTVHISLLIWIQGYMDTVNETHCQSVLNPYSAKIDYVDPYKCSTHLPSIGSLQDKYYY